jgi:serine/threonine-protein kinase
MERPTLVIPSIEGLRVVRVLGRGGMGAVFLAVDDVTRQAVALKVIAGDLAIELAARTRFEREIAAVTAIRHRNIVRLLRAGVADGVPYALFERVRGRTLPRLGAQPWPVVVDIGRQLALAIAAVHAAHWLHRDLKPSNVMIGSYGLVTLIDFGLARHVTDPEISGGLSSPHDAALTLGGNVVGTRRYLAPELMRGRVATPASDVYSLGVTLHQLLGGALDDQGGRTGPEQLLPQTFSRMLHATLSHEPERRPSARVLAATLARMPARRAQFRAETQDDAPTWPMLADDQGTRGSAA